MASAFQSDAFQANAFESIADNLTANPGSIVLKGASANLLPPGALNANAGSITLTGASATLVGFGAALTANAGSIVMTGASASLAVVVGTLTANAGAIALAGVSATLDPGLASLKANPGAIVLTGKIAGLTASLLAKSGAIVLTGAPTEILAPESEVFYLNTIVDLVPASITSKSRRFGERLTVGAAVLKVKSWSYEETDADISGSLQVELANISDRSLVTNTAVIKFELGEFANGAWKYQTLVDTGSLDRSDYAISPSGVGSPDTFTFTGASEMNARLNKVSVNTLVIFDLGRHQLTADDFEGIYNGGGGYYAPEVVGISGLSLYKLLTLLFSGRAGFSKIYSNIPDFPLGIVELAAGSTFIEAVGGIIGMFEPDFSTTINQLGQQTLWIRDGTALATPSAPALKVISIAQAKSLGIANEAGGKVDALLIDVTQERNTFDYYTDRKESGETRAGTQGAGGQILRTAITTKFRDFFRRSKPETPVKTETKQIVRTTFSNGVRTNESVENFTYDSLGRLKERNKRVRALVAQVNNKKTYLGSEYRYNEAGAEVLYDEWKISKVKSLGFVPVEEELEIIKYKMHPFEPRTFYISVREVNKTGLIYTDGENQQMGEDYARSAMDAYRAGNVHEDMTGGWDRISTFREEITPKRGGRVLVRTFEYEYPTEQLVRDDEEIRDGEVGTNIFVQEQRRFYVLPKGATGIQKGVESMNMGELPLELAVALGSRILRQKATLPHRVAFGYIGIDNTIQKGSLLNVTGRAGENLGYYIVESRTLAASGDGYFMTLQARQSG